MDQRTKNEGFEETVELMPIHGPIPLLIPDGYQCVSTSIDFQGNLIQFFVPFIVAADVSGTWEQPGWAIFPNTRAEKNYNAIVQITSETNAVRFELRSVDAAFPKVQILSDGKILVVSSRCHRRKDGTHENNAKIFIQDGSLETEFCLGDGIEDIQVDSSDRLWVGYFDEGIFGNFGWGGYADTGYTEPIGSSGLECFDKNGEGVWSFSPADGFDSPASVYALNACRDGVWVVYYTDFPIVKIDQQNRVTAWNTNLSGTSQIAVSGELLLAYGGYAEKSKECLLLHLGDGNAQRLANVKLDFPDGSKLKDSNVIGRGEYLHVISDNAWYKFKVPSSF